MICAACAQITSGDFSIRFLRQYLPLFDRKSPRCASCTNQKSVLAPVSGVPTQLYIPHPLRIGQRIQYTQNTVKSTQMKDTLLMYISMILKNNLNNFSAGLLLSLGCNARPLAKWLCGFVFTILHVLHDIILQK